MFFYLCMFVYCIHICMHVYILVKINKKSPPNRYASYNKIKSKSVFCKSVFFLCFLFLYITFPLNKVVQFTVQKLGLKICMIWMLLIQHLKTSIWCFIWLNPTTQLKLDIICYDKKNHGMFSFIQYFDSNNFWMQFDFFVMWKKKKKLKKNPKNQY